MNVAATDNYSIDPAELRLNSALDLAHLEESNIMAFKLTSELRVYALECGWPEHIVTQLEIQSTGGDLHIYYPESIADEVEDLEYGTISVPPHSVLRRFWNRLHLFVNDVSDVDLLENLVHAMLEG